MATRISLALSCCNILNLKKENYEAHGHTELSKDHGKAPHFTHMWISNTMLHIARDHVTCKQNNYNRDRTANVYCVQLRNM
jgi:hypothetical protein